MKKHKSKKQIIYSILAVIVIVIGVFLDLAGGNEDGESSSFQETVTYVANNENSEAGSKNSEISSENSKTGSEVSETASKNSEGGSEVSETDSKNSEGGSEMSEESQESTENTEDLAESETLPEDYVAYYFRNDNLLEQHYEKHGIEMGFDSMEEYEEAACAVIYNPDVLTKTEKEDGDYVYYVEETNEFVILSQDGYIRTYFNPSAGIDYYNRQ